MCVCLSTVKECIMSAPARFVNLILPVLSQIDRQTNRESENTVY